MTSIHQSIVDTLLPVLVANYNATLEAATSKEDPEVQAKREKVERLAKEFELLRQHHGISRDYFKLTQDMIFLGLDLPLPTNVKKSNVFPIFTLIKLNPRGKDYNGDYDGYGIVTSEKELYYWQDNNDYAIYRYEHHELVTSESEIKTFLEGLTSPQQKHILASAVFAPLMSDLFGDTDEEEADEIPF